MANDNKLLGQFNLEGIPPAPRGVPQIEVTFDIDAKASGGLSDDEIEKMVKDAEANKEADKKKREAVDIRNQADTLIHSTDKNLKEHGSKITPEEKKTIEDSSVITERSFKR